jgi:hypothetical protein
VSNHPNFPAGVSLLEQKKAGCGWSFLAPLGLFLLVAGFRLGALDFAGSPLPFFDQWIAEFYNTLLVPAVADSEWGGLLFVPHNEHRLVFTKVLVLAFYSASGTYDVLLLATFAALLYGGLAAAVFGMVSAGATKRDRVLLWLATALFFAVPFAGYNVLCGMQISFTLAQLGLLVVLRSVAEWRDDRTGAIGMLVGTVFGVLNLGSGAVIPGALLIAGLLGSAARRRAFWLGWLACVLIVLCFVLAARGGAQARDWNAIQFGFSLLAWPWSSAGLGVIVGVSLIGILGVVGRRGTADASAPICIAAGILAFGAGNLLLLAVSRAPEEFHMRHWETVALVPFGLLTLLILLGARIVPGRGALWWRGAVVFVFGFYGAGVAKRFTDVTVPYYQAGHLGRDAALVRMREELLKDGGVTLAREVPEAWERLGRGVFDDPLWRHFLPEPVGQAILRHPREAIGLLTPSVLEGRESSRVSAVAAALRKAWGVIVALGLGCVLLGLIRGSRGDHAQGLGGREGR